MKFKSLSVVAAVAACQPTSIYPKTQGLEVIETYSFGIGTMPKSSITVFNDGPCDQVVFDNTLTGSTDVITTRLGGHYIMIQMGSHTVPDIMSVSPAAGYYVDGPDEISVEDGSIGTIVVCMETMS